MQPVNRAESGIVFVEVLHHELCGRTLEVGAGVDADLGHRPASAAATAEQETTLIIEQQ